MSRVENAQALVCGVCRRYVLTTPAAVERGLCPLCAVVVPVAQ